MNQRIKWCGDMTPDASKLIKIKSFEMIIAYPYSREE
jgi:hypothetical protein